jgi:cytochrome c-type biogenesis protein
MLAAGGVNTTVLAAFAVGVVSFISPCVLPLVPGYLSAISGVSFADIEAGRSRRQVLVPSLLFCLSFTLMFVALGMTATGIGSTLRDSKETLDRVAGFLIVGMGIFFVLTPFVPRLNREWRPDALIRRAGAGGPIVAGLAFAIAWTPCVGPTLGAILGLASTSSGTGRGAALLAFYSLGLALPFLFFAVAFSSAQRAFGWVKRHYAAIQVVAGAILIVMGVLVFTGELFQLNIKAQNLLRDLGLDFYNGV